MRTADKSGRQGRGPQKFLIVVRDHNLLLHFESRDRRPHRTYHLLNISRSSQPQLALTEGESSMHLDSDWKVSGREGLVRQTANLVLAVFRVVLCKPISFFMLLHTSALHALPPSLHHHEAVPLGRYAPALQSISLETPARAWRCFLPP